MVAIFILSLALFTGATSAADFDQYDLALNGTSNVTALHQFPSVVQVEFLDYWGWNVWTQNCAATILTSRWLLSAATCFSGPTYPSTRSRRIRAGAVYRHFGGQIVDVDFEVNYQRNVTNKTALIYDMSVVRLRSPLFYSNLVSQGAIIASGFQIPTGLVVNQNSSELTIAPVTIGVRLYPSNGTHPTILVGHPSVGEVSGDIGGPWFVGNVSIAVLSGFNTNVTWTDSIYATSISSFTNWIVSIAST
ncbi:uncharacterized protein LOC112043360 [Bicyclus anynana]|uniref:Uncharacterized protein LOC112043360 n=1 Tax=Bicyclus anynana TaxID=110368 RepID=A0A6J1MJG5_BICAN|nr:uncharacterized protein LOC112043360 [Bicyclus anynana]